VAERRAVNGPDSLVLTILWLLGGLGLFLYGIETMGRALRRVAGLTLRRGLGTVTRTRLRGLATGAVATGLLQSSSASTVMVVGFIHAGLLTFRQSVSLILGANIGTTVTPQITAWDLDRFSLPLLGVGFAINFLARRRVLREFGTALMAFGMLFFGLMIMKFAVSRYEGTFQIWLEHFTSGGLRAQVLAFLVATAVTAIIQSSAATIALLQVLAVAGPDGQAAIGSLEVALPMILGAQVGTCVTALLASLRSSLSARRAAVAHLVFNLLGVGITVVLYQAYLRLVPMVSGNLPRQIAMCHLAIKLVNVGLVLPWAMSYGRLIERILPGEDLLNAAPEHLNYAAFGDPETALRSAAAEIRRIFVMCRQMFPRAVAALLDGDEHAQEVVLKREDIVDELVRAVQHYLVEVSGGGLPEGLETQPALLSHIVSDVERIGDHAENVVEMSRTYAGQDVRLSRDAEKEVRTFAAEVDELAGLALEHFDDPRAGAGQQALAKKKAVNATFDRFVRAHARRLASGECTVLGAVLYLDLMTNLRRVANHLRNVTLTVSGERPALTAGEEDEHTTPRTPGTPGAAETDETEGD
jgi:phosphate:Na+ symporter